MTTESMIRELRYQSTKHKISVGYTGELTISDICNDVADRLEHQNELIERLCIEMNNMKLNRN